MCDNWYEQLYWKGFVYYDQRAFSPWCFVILFQNIFWLKADNIFFFQFWVMIYLSLTALSTCVLCAESLPQYWDTVSENMDISDYNSSLVLSNLSSTGQRRVFNRNVASMELIINSIFSTVWLLNVLTCPSIKTLVTRFPFWVNMISLSSSWIIHTTRFYETGVLFYGPLYIRMAVPLRSLRTWRFVRVFQVMRGWEIIALTLRRSVWELCILLVFFLTGMIAFSSLIYYAEYSNPDFFQNIPIGFWWAIVTMTTVGYGDIYPTTPYGYVVGAICAIMGMFAIAIPIPVISANFSQLRRDMAILNHLDTRGKTQNVDDQGQRDSGYRCPVCNTRILIDKPTTVSVVICEQWKTIRVM